jgi:hypothetical protein
LQVVEEAVKAAWASGTNIYRVTVGNIVANVLPILGEVGIKTFVSHVGQQLDKFNTQPRHRKAWKSLLDAL